jgi:hypothetical protein
MFYKEKSRLITMKNTIKFMLSVLILVLALQFSSACVSTHHNPYNDLNADDGVILIVQQVPANEYYNYNNYEWENEDRYPVYDYRYGYSYRSTPEYQEYHEEYNGYNEQYYSQSANYYYDSHATYYQSTPEVYYTYDDYMRRYTPHECYTHPPSDRFFYIKC